MLFKIKIENINDIDWNYFWKEGLKEKGNLGANKNWDKAAEPYEKLNAKDDYTDKLINNLILDKSDSLLDIGAGEGSVSIPLSEKVKNITSVDSSKKMIELFDKRIREKSINNIETIEMDISDINLDSIGHKDIVLASRSINSFPEMEDLLINLNEIANKYVFITFFGPNNWRMEKEFYNFIDKNYTDHPSYVLLLNLLEQIGIYANVINLDVGPVRTYDDIDEAMVNGKWKLDNYSDKEKGQLHEFLSKTLQVDSKTKKLFNPLDKPDWVLIWWKKEDQMEI
ncbi:MAG: class I SAM-dependent methyltransferase [Methanobacteriaceae archaeon]|jgi:ubiquinone/menaquinone biosynthesis C-methylase UbiE|uniref:class I SAM-dependent methyltransferase n=1 Tax=unclassified Methanobrevibacter TaxID=2638681 RepID=UPI00376263D3|nr:class I SAM-dependent methyltransferase [Methanobacteriaceae archaeon]MDD4594126.1 class I SAM-dependent methyltransferase [Methanobacteriaceae archaeon]